MPRQYNKGIVSELLAEEQSVQNYAAMEGSKTQEIGAEATAALIFVWQVFVGVYYVCTSKIYILFHITFLNVSETSIPEHSVHSLIKFEVHIDTLINVVSSISTFNIKAVNCNLACRNSSVLFETQQNGY